jgi:hypothetical protein
MVEILLLMNDLQEFRVSQDSRYAPSVGGIELAHFPACGGAELSLGRSASCLGLPMNARRDGGPVTRIADTTAVMTPNVAIANMTVSPGDRHSLRYCFVGASPKSVMKGERSVARLLEKSSHQPPMVISGPTEAITDGKDILILMMSMLKEVSQLYEEREKPRGFRDAEGTGTVNFQHCSNIGWLKAFKVLPLHC